MEREGKVVFSGGKEKGVEGKGMDEGGKEMIKTSKGGGYVRVGYGVKS